MKLIFIILGLLASVLCQAADVKVGNLPIGVASTTNPADSFPYVDSVADVLRRMTLSDIVNLPSFVGLGTKLNVVTKTTNYSISLGDNIILVDATGGPVTITALLASVMFSGGKTLIDTIKKIDATANSVIVSASGSDTIDGASSQTLTKQNQAMDILSSGSNLYVK